MVGRAPPRVGLITRPAAFVVSATRAVACWMFHAPRNLLPVLNGGAAATLHSFAFPFLVLGGLGRWGLDPATQRGRAAP